MSPEQLKNHPTKGKRIELVVQQLNSLPTLPAVAARLLQVTIDSRTQAQEVVGLIESDPSLAGKIIALASGVHSGLRRRTVSVSKAVVLLGFNAIRNAVLSIQVFEVLADPRRAESDAGAVDLAGLWRHSLAVACATKMLVPYFDVKTDPEEAFVCGLLHDIGKLALATALPKSFARVVQLSDSSLANIADVEQQILGIDHTIAGKRLAEKWRLPQAIIETIWLHHQGPDGLPPEVASPAIVQAVHLGDLLTRQQRIGYSGNHNMDQDLLSVAEQLRCPPEAIEQVSRRLCDEISERAKLLGLDDIEPEELYRQAVADANQHLARINQQLNQQNKALQARSNYFQLLVDLDDALEADQSVGEVCSLVAELWHRHATCDQCAVYAIDPQNLVVEGVVKLDDQEPTAFFIDRADDGDAAPNAINLDASAPFAIAAPNENDNWLFEQALTDFDIDSTVTMPLQGGNNTVGGILWQGGRDENNCREELLEMQAFSAAAATAIQSARQQELHKSLGEQLAQLNRQLRQSQNELLKKQSMTAVGEMACGAAHEINNPLAVVVGRAQLLADSQQDEQCRTAAETIVRKSNEITQIIAELVEFARPTPPQVSVTPVGALAAAAVAAVDQYARDNNASVDIQPLGNLPTICIDHEQCAPALAELLTNAIDSYHGTDGTVTIKGRHDQFADEVILEIIDHGCGMDQRTLSNAFAPFFSDRPAGRGRGLGLSRASRCIEANGGRVLLRSELGQGTTAEVRLPVSQVVEATEFAVP